MRARSVWLAGITAVGVLMLGGCADEETPASLPPVSTSADSTSTTTSEADPTSSPSHQDVEADIRSFYEDYARLADQSFQSREALEETRRFFADSCTSCVAGYEIAKRVLDQGHVVEGNPVRVLAVEVDSIEGNNVIFRGVLDVPAATVRDLSGARVEEFPATPHVTTLYRATRQPDGSWIIVSDQVLG